MQTQNGVVPQNLFIECVYAIRTEITLQITFCLPYSNDSMGDESQHNHVKPRIWMFLCYNKRIYRHMHSAEINLFITCRYSVCVSTTACEMLSFSRMYIVHRMSVCCTVTGWLIGGYVTTGICVLLPLSLWLNR